MSKDIKLAVPPQNIEAERAILGGILLDHAAIERARGILKPEDFYTSAHQIIYRQMLHLVDVGESIDNVVLVEHLRTNNLLKKAGGAGYIAELLADTASAANIVSHADIVVEKARLRRLRTQAVVICTEIDAGANLDRVTSLLPDAASLQRETVGGVATLPVITAASLLETEESDPSVQWVLDSMIAVGSLVGLIAKPKVGKTTLVYELAVKLAQGLPFLGRASQPSAVLMLCLEEHEREVKRRLRALGAENLDNLHLVIESLDADSGMFAQLKRTVEALAIRLIIIDTLNSLWKVNDENNAAEVTRAIKPFLRLARSTNAAIIVIHHARKSEGEHGDEIRGSGALFSLLDAAFILKRHESGTQRKLTAISRWSETPPELILELRDHGYECLGDAATAGRKAKSDKLLAALTSEPQTAKELAIRAVVPFRSAYSLIDDLLRAGRVSRLGEGRRGNPFRFVSCLIDKGGV